VSEADVDELDRRIDELVRAGLEAKAERLDLGRKVADAMLLAEALVVLDEVRSRMRDWKSRRDVSPLGLVRVNVLDVVARIGRREDGVWIEAEATLDVEGMTLRVASQTKAEALSAMKASYVVKGLDDAVEAVLRKKRESDAVGSPPP
jgi:hypothetical protein